jgi:hypothetical protein
MTWRLAREERLAAIMTGAFLYINHFFSFMERRGKREGRFMTC